jgi:hypothetical protein
MNDIPTPKLMHPPPINSDFKQERYGGLHGATCCASSFVARAEYYPCSISGRLFCWQCWDRLMIGDPYLHWAGGWEACEICGESPELEGRMPGYKRYKYDQKP